MTSSPAFSAARRVASKVNAAPVFACSKGSIPVSAKGASRRPDFFSGEFDNLIGQAGHAAARPSQARGEPGRDKLGRDRHDDRDGLGGRLGTVAAGMPWVTITSTLRPTSPPPTTCRLMSPSTNALMRTSPDGVAEPRSHRETVQRNRRASSRPVAGADSPGFSALRSASVGPGESREDLGNEPDYSPVAVLACASYGRRTRPSRATIVPGRAAAASAATRSMKASSWSGSWWKMTRVPTCAASARRTASCQVECPQP